MTAAVANEEARRPQGRLAISRHAAMGWGLMSPALVILAIMAIAPAIYLVYVSFRHENLLGPGSMFVGLQNFSRVLSNRENWTPRYRRSNSSCLPFRSNSVSGWAWRCCSTAGFPNPIC